MKVRTIDSPEITKSKHYFKVKMIILCLVVLCVAVGVFIKNRFSQPYKQVLDDLCMAIEKADGTYMQKHMPTIQEEDGTESDVAMKSQWSEELDEEEKQELNGYVLGLVSQILGDDQQMEDSMRDAFQASRDLPKKNSIQNVRYEIIEKHKMKSWDVTSKEEDESTETADINQLQNYTGADFLDVDEEEANIGFSDYAYEYSRSIWGTKKKYKVFDKDQAYMLLVDFSFLQDGEENTYQTMVYVAKSEKRWVLLSVINMKDYENIIFQED